VALKVAESNLKVGGFFFFPYVLWRYSGRVRSTYTHS